MQTLKYIIVCIAIVIGMPACTDLDIAPMNIVQDKDIFGSEDGVMSYMARLYKDMPIEDFRYAPRRGSGFNEFYVIDPISNFTGEALNNDRTGAGTESDALKIFGDGYKLIRDINYFIETLPQFAASSNFSTDQVNTWTGEAYLIRGFTYFALAKRFGGVPIVNEVLQYPEQSIEELQIARSSEQASFEQAAADMDKAYSLLPETSSKTRLNKYTAAGFKARTMLYAASIAKYNTTTLEDNDGNLLCGIPESKAAEYFKAAYDASVLLDGKYSLYKEGWKADDKQAQYQNYVDMFFKDSSDENIFIRQYKYPTVTHGYDVYNIPLQFRVGGYASYTNPTLDLVEMYDGLPKTADGKINVYENGTYKMFTNQMDLFANAEPRLRATVIFPGDLFKGEVVEIWRGIYRGNTNGGIASLVGNSKDPYETLYDGSMLVTSSTENQTPHTLPDGTLMNPAGRSGCFYSDKGRAITGFSIRKWLNPNMPAAEVKEHYSAQSWIELRYAEILLTRAEAAYELHQAGKSEIDYVDDAFKCINLIRERAGADLLANNAALNHIDIIRTERRKELAFENKTFWDLRRWRIMDQEQKSDRQYRILMPFYAENSGEWFFDVRYDEHSKYTFQPLWYYSEIRSEEMNKNKKLIQNPGY